MTTITRRAFALALGGALALPGAGCTDSNEGGLPTELEPSQAEAGAYQVEVLTPDLSGQPGKYATPTPRVRVTQGGAPVRNINVHFWVVEGGGTLTRANVRTDSRGRAATRWRLGPDWVLNRMRASAMGVGVDMEVMPTPPDPGEAAADVEVTPGSLEFEAFGAEEQLAAIVLSESGDQLDARVTWRSLNSQVVTVDSTGIVRSLSNGTTRVIASAANGVADTAQVTVAQRVASVVVAPALDTVAVDGTVQLAATVRDANGYVVQNPVMQWASSHPLIASVTALGLVTGVSSGIAIITATSDGVSGNGRVEVVSSEPPPPPPPGEAQILFHSDWSTGTGSGDYILTDGAKPRSWSNIVGNGARDQVVPSSGLDFPTQNVYASIADNGGSGTRVLAQHPRLTNGALPTIAVGEVRTYRWYLRVVAPDALDTRSGGTPHPIQDGPNGSTTNWMFEFIVNQDGTFRPGFNVGGENPWPNNRWALRTSLQKNRTYRMEFQVHRTGTDTFVPSFRIYDSAGNLLFDDDDIVNQNGTGSTSFASRPTLRLGHVDVLDEFQVGNNGPGWTIPQSAFPFPLWYTGAVAICAGDWCGPYSSAEND